MTQTPPDNHDEPTPIVDFDPVDGPASAESNTLPASSPIENNAFPPIEETTSHWFRRAAFPGIEAILWMVGTLIAMVSGSVAGVVAVGVLLAATGSGGGFSPDLLEKEAMLPAVIGSQVFLIGFAALGVFLRFGTHCLQTLGLRRLTNGHVLAIVGLTLPVQFLAHSWSTWVNELLDSIGISLSTQDYLDQMQQIMSAGPLAVMWLLMAVSPAVGEELIFRGLIGNVLLKNWGPWLGVIATSILFGVIHIMPVQAIDVIPLGIAMHYVYLMTKSFWAPVLLHLANNSLALVMMESAGEISDADSMDQSLGLPSITVSALTAACLAAILFQTRRRRATAADVIDSSQDQQPIPTARLLTAAPANGLTIAAAVLSLLGNVALVVLAFAE